MITAFQANAFQASPLAFQIGTPAPPPVTPEEYGGGGLANFDPSFIKAARERLERPQRDAEDLRKRQLEEKQELDLLVRRAYNKAAGIEEPEEATVPSLPTAVLPEIDIPALTQAIQAQVEAIGLQVKQAQIRREIERRRQEAIRLAELAEHNRRIDMIMQAEAHDDAEMDEMMAETERLFEAARKMLS